MNHSRSGRGRATGPAITIIVEEPKWRTDGIAIRAIRRAARLAVKSVSAGQQDGPAVSVLLAGDTRLRHLNLAFRNQRQTTNVLSFPALPDQSPYLGDVALGYGILCREASTQNKSLAEHAAHLTVHGVLHLVGYDHEYSRDAAVMEKLEISLLAKMGFPDPYRVNPVRRRPKRHKLATCLRIPAR